MPSPYDDTPLHVAVRKGLIGNVRRILATRTIDPGAVNSEKCTALDLALGSCREGGSGLDMVKALLAAGIDINQEDQSGETCRDRSSRDEDAAELMPILAAHGGRAGSGAVREAIQHGQIDRFRTLIAQRANVNAPDWQGLTALHLLVQPYFEDDRAGGILTLLLSAGADIDREDLDGHTPLDLGLRNRKDDLVAILRAHGAKTGSGISRRPLSFVPDFVAGSPFYFDVTQLDQGWIMAR
jgi:ankyrin repeat protein